MPRKQRFKPTRKPKLMNEGATERAQDSPNPPKSEELMSNQPPRNDEERRSE